MMRPLVSYLRRFCRADSGAATIEFAILFPAFIIFLVSAIEMGVMNARNSMLERALDLAVRDIQINTATAPTHDDVKRMICSHTSIIPDCFVNMRIEMLPINTRVATSIDPAPDCVDTLEPFEPVRQFRNGSQNQIMLIRVCSLFRPMFPTTGLGFQLPRTGGQDTYALVAVSAFVMEPL